MPTCLISRTCGRRCLAGRAGSLPSCVWAALLDILGNEIGVWSNTKLKKGGREHDVLVATARDRNDEDEDELL